MMDFLNACVCKWCYSNQAFFMTITLWLGHVPWHLQYSALPCKQLYHNDDRCQCHEEHKWCYRNYYKVVLFQFLSYVTNMVFLLFILLKQTKKKKKNRKNPLLEYSGITLNATVMMALIMSQIQSYTFLKISKSQG